MADTKKMRSIEERKAAMLAEVAELEAKQLEKYRKELAAKGERLVKAKAQVAKYTAEVDALEIRSQELLDIISELEVNGSVTTDDTLELEVELTSEPPVLEYSNA